MLAKASVVVGPRVQLEHLIGILSVSAPTEILIPIRENISQHYRVVVHKAVWRQSRARANN